MLIINIFSLLLTSLCLVLLGCQKNDEKGNYVSSSASQTEEQTINICIANAASPTTQTIALERLPNIEKVEILSSQKIWILTGFEGGNIFSTIDGGKSWVKLEIQESSYFNAFDFVDEQNGWTSDTQNNIWRTNDGGKNWTKSSPFAKLIEEKNFAQIHQIEFPTINNGWVRDAFNIYQTSDGGVSWRAANLSLKEPQAMFLSQNNGWIVFNRESSKSYLQIEATSNNGDSWQSSRIEDVSSAQTMFFVDENYGWISGFPNKLFSTKNAGKSWEKVALDEKKFQIKSIYWLNKNEGWLAGAVIDPDKPVSDNSASVPTLLHTKDAGETWEKSQPADAKRFFNQVYFENSSAGWLISKDRIYRTGDGGKSWQSVLKVNATKNCK